MAQLESRKIKWKKSAYSLQDKITVLEWAEKNNIKKSAVLILRHFNQQRKGWDLKEQTVRDGLKLGLPHFKALLEKGKN